MATRPFRFGAKSTKAGSAKEWTDLVKRVEDLGYESFQMDDHFGSQLGTVPADEIANEIRMTVGRGSRTHHN